MANENKFYPYTSNGGSTLGICGPDFAILPGDTRSTSGYSINTRFEPKVYTIQDHENHPIVLSVIGFAADGRELKERLDTLVSMYKYQHEKNINLFACAQRVCTLLYQKRFFPYHLQTMVAGLDADGQGAIYYYDPAGSCEKRVYCAAGEASSLMLPFLDSQIPRLEPLDRGVAESLVKDAFRSATERHIEVGDHLQMLVVTREGISERVFDLRKD